MSKEILRKIEQLNERCPIEFPDQLYLRKGEKYIQSYDPVYSIKVDSGTLFVEGCHHTVYEHDIQEFDGICIIRNESVDLHNPTYTKDEIRDSRLAEENTNDQL